MLDKRKKIGLLIGVLFLLLLAGYALFRSQVVLFGVHLTINGVVDGGIYTNPDLELSGSAPNATLVSINDEQIPIDKNGTFEDSLILAPGSSIITVKAKDKFGHTATRTFRVYYQNK